MSVKDWVKQLYLFQYYKQEMEAFYCYLIFTYRHADINNKKNIGKGFFEFVIAMELWDQHGNEVFNIFDVSEKNMFQMNEE